VCHTHTHTHTYAHTHAHTHAPQMSVQLLGQQQPPTKLPIVVGGDGKATVVAEAGAEWEVRQGLGWEGASESSRRMQWLNVADGDGDALP